MFALFFVDYDRSPEAQYPIAIEQVYAATKYMVEHGGSWESTPRASPLSATAPAATLPPR